MPLEETIQVFRVEGRGSSRELIRSRVRARRTLSTILVDREGEGDLYVKIGARRWRKMGSRAAVMGRFDSWKSGATFAVATRRTDGMHRLATVRREGMQILHVANCSAGVTMAWSLIRHQFPGVAFGGGYVPKQTSPGVWSDHAWGDAVDASAYDQNDRVTAWVAEMASEGLMVFDYALGSRGGDVVIIYGSGSVHPSGASSSHEWHVHLSIVDHDGRKP